MNDKNEHVYKQLAGRYLDAQGGDLLRELAALPQPDIWDTARMDARVYAETKQHKRRWIGVVSGLAASLLMLVLAGSAVLLLRWLNGSGNAAVSPTALTAELPARLSIAAEETDQGQTVYWLADKEGDDVVLTLAPPDSAPDTAGLGTVQVAGRTVYARAGGGYNLVTFQQGNTLYTMTCRYDLGTLLELSASILKR